MLLIRTLGVFFWSSGDGAAMRACFALTPHYLLLVKAMVLEGGIDDFETTRRTNVRGVVTRHSKAF